MNAKIVLTILLVLVVTQAAFYDEVIQYIVEIISEVSSSALSYEWPKNADEYYADGERKYFGSYDFVIIGAGAGGSVAANRLSEISSWNVLVLEAGEFGNILTDIPNMYFPIQFTNYNWGYNSTPQTTACLGLENRQCLYPRGKGVGGSSLIDGLVYSRGHKSDFDNWAKVVGSKRWGYASVLNFYKKSEHFVANNPEAPTEPKYHGQFGFNRVEYHVDNSPQLDAFLAANQELNLGVVDYNANKLGASPSQLNTLFGRRLHNAKAFLDPVQHRSNLHILPESYVTKIRINNHSCLEASGVEFNHKGQKYFVEATKEVILTAGVFGSAQILMLSGIGPKEHLESVGIDVLKDLEVGTTLRDHPTFFGINFLSNYSEPIRSLPEYVVEFLGGRGPLTVPGSNQGVGFYESSYSKGTGIPDIELMFIPANATSELSQRSFGLTDQTYEDLWMANDVPKSFIMYVVDLHSQSVGTVRLRSKDPYEYPLINSNFLSDPENRDINTLYEGIQLVLQLANTKALQSMGVQLQGRLRACNPYPYLSKGYWYCALRQMTINLYHPVGTCPMGKNPRDGAVVDHELKVFGVDRLRVADASVFPFTIAAHTNAPTVMIGEQLGDLVKKKHEENELSFWDNFFFK